METIFKGNDFVHTFSVWHPCIETASEVKIVPNLEIGSPLAHGL